MSIHVAANDIVSLFFIAEQYSVLCIYHIFFIHSCQWTFRLFPCLGYCKQCCYEHQGACIFLNYGGFFFFFWYTRLPCLFSIARQINFHNFLMHQNGMCKNPERLSQWCVFSDPQPADGTSSKHSVSLAWVGRHGQARGLLQLPPGLPPIACSQRKHL